MTVVDPHQASANFQAIRVHQLGQSSVKPDYYHYYGPFGDGCFLVGLILGDGTHGGLLDASGRSLRFFCKDEVRRFCGRFNRAEKTRVQRFASNGLL